MRGMIRFSGARLVLLIVTLFAMALAAGASATTSVTIGQTNAAANYLCGTGFPGVTPGTTATSEYDLQTGVASGTTGFAVPAGAWVITSWSTYAGSLGGSMSMMVFSADHRR